MNDFISLIFWLSSLVISYEKSGEKKQQTKNKHKLKVRLDSVLRNLKFTLAREHQALSTV